MRRVVLFLYLFLLWLLLVWSVDWQHLFVGFLLASVLGWIYGNTFVTEWPKVFQIRRWFWFFLYIPVFSWEMIKANLDVAYRVLHPRMPIRPGIVKVKTTIRSDMGKTFLANSITLTPGTLTVDIEGQILYIHWIYVRTKEIETATQHIVRRFEPFLIKIFD